jgi:hypothetical protein
MTFFGLTGDERPASHRNGSNQLTHQGGFADAGGARDEQKLGNAAASLIEGTQQPVNVVFSAV